MTKFFEIAAGINSTWSLLAFAIAAIMFVVSRVNKKAQIRQLALVSVFVIALLALVPVLSSFYFDSAGKKDNAVYRIRITVLDENNLPTEATRVWSTFGGETKKVSGGFEIDIPIVSIPKDSDVTIFAELPNAFLKGSTTVKLKTDFNPVGTIKLQKDSNTFVRGSVQDQNGNALAEVKVNIIGYGSVVTDSTGNFVVPAHAARNQQVLLHAEKKGYRAFDLWVPAGSENVIIPLKK